MNMKKSIILAGLIAVFSTIDVFAQKNPEPESMLVAVCNQCREIVKLSDDNDALKKKIKQSEWKLDSLKKAWKETCLKYIYSSGVKKAEELDFLISHTDSIFDGADLLNQLKAERDKMPPTSSGKGFSFEPVETPVPASKPIDSKTEEGNENKDKDKPVEKGEKKETRENVPKLPVESREKDLKDDGGDIDDEVKNKISDNGK